MKPRCQVVVQNSFAHACGRPFTKITYEMLLYSSVYRGAVEFLCNEGHIYSTIDDYHYKSTDAWLHCDKVHTSPVLKLYITVIQHTLNVTFKVNVDIFDTSVLLPLAAFEKYIHQLWAISILWVDNLNWLMDISGYIIMACTHVIVSIQYQDPSMSTCMLQVLKAILCCIYFAGSDFISTFIKNLHNN